MKKKLPTSANNKFLIFTTTLSILFTFTHFAYSKPYKQRTLTATLSESTFPAKGKNESILTVSDFGRYSIIAKSKQGTSIKLIDKMAGPSREYGTAGKKDGRIDIFLEIGEYKIITTSHDLGLGDLKLEAHPFIEKNKDKKELIEHKTIEGELKDFKQVSYWLNITTKRNIILETAGRNLKDIRIWKNGSWLVDTSPNTSTIEPVIGHPLTLCQLTTTLNSGLYLITAYGGEAKEWAEESDKHPFYLRFGIPKLAEAGRSVFRTSNFGYDRWLIPKDANFFRLELDKSEESKIEVANFYKNSPFNNNPKTQTITKKSLLPIAEIRLFGISSG